jgi:hypothetical protein
LKTAKLGLDRVGLVVITSPVQNVVSFQETKGRYLIPPKKSVLNSTAASKNSVSLFFFESQQIKITVQAQESTKITSLEMAPKFIAMSRPHKLITLTPNTTHKIV